MTIGQTEAVHDRAGGLDVLPDAEVLARLLDGQLAAVQTVSAALGDIARGADLMAEALRSGGTLVYAGAGSSALMAAADGMELAGTFGMDPALVVLLMAGGLPTGSEMPGGTEDDMVGAERDAAGIAPGDAVIVVTASGSTPYALRLAECARARRARTICMANVAGAAVFAHADVAICLPTPPELIAGSTRMGAGSAQKTALNLMSTLMGIRLGHVHDGMMVNLRADNDKLRKRARAMVARIAGTTDPAARAALDQTGGAVKPAVLLLCGAKTPQSAAALIGECNGSLRAAIARLAPVPETTRKTEPNQERTK
ncbi:MAG: N-acetylmuramic acid 6-phosphate etherase [Marinibacterium sp.]